MIEMKKSLGNRNLVESFKKTKYHKREIFYFLLVKLQNGKLAQRNEFVGRLEMNGTVMEKDNQIEVAIVEVFSSFYSKEQNRRSKIKRLNVILVTWLHRNMG